MKNTEKLLTNIPRIIELKLIGLSYEEIANELNNQSGLNVTEKTIRNILYYIKTDKLNKKYNNFILIDVSTDLSYDFYQCSIYAHGLYIANAAVMKYFNYGQHILTAKNYKKLITTEEGAIYAKRLLKDYLSSDKEIIENIRLKNPISEKINYQETINDLHENLSIEVANWISKLKTLSTNLTLEKGIIK